MRRLAITALIFALWVPASRAGDPGADLYDRLSGQRLSIERLDDARRALISRRDAISGSLEQLARRIEKRKAARGKAELLPDLELQSMLRRSQEAAAKLTLLNRELEALNGARKQQLEKLAALYDELTRQTSLAAGRATGGERANILNTLERLRRERLAIGRELLAGVERAAPLKTDDLLASDDPDELAERADAVRDEQDRLRKKLAYLNRRIADTNARMRLDRQAHDFVADQQLFGEDSRVLKVTRPAASDTGPSSFSGSDGKQNVPADRDDPVAGGYDAAPAECSGGMCGTPSDGSLSGGGSDEPGVRIEQGSLPMGVDADDARLDSLSPRQLFKALRRKRSQVITRIKKLQILQDRIQEKVERLRGE